MQLHFWRKDIFLTYAYRLAHKRILQEDKFCCGENLRPISHQNISTAKYAEV